MFNGTKVARMQDQIEAMGKTIAEFTEARAGLSPRNIKSFDAKAYTSFLGQKDLILCANRYVWRNLPINLTSQELEAMFYQWGSLCFFEKDGRLMISRYAKVGELTPFGKLQKIIPIDFKGRTYGEEMSVIEPNGAKPADGTKCAVIINDYTHWYLPDYEPGRSAVNGSTTIRDQVNVYIQLDLNIRMSVKKALALCENEEQKRMILQQANQIMDPNVPIVAVAKSKQNKERIADLPMEMWNWQNTFDTQNYCQQIDFYDKVRRQGNGIPSPDTFEKKERKITAEAENTNAHVELVLEDGLLCRQHGLELLQTYSNIEGLESVTVEVSEILRPKVEETMEDYSDDDEEFEQDEQ